MLSPVENFQAIEGKGVQGQIDQQLVTLGNGKLHDGTAMDPELEKRMVELQEQAKTVINLAVDGQVIGLIAIQDVSEGQLKRSDQKLKERGLKTVMLTGIMNGWPKLLLKVGIDTVIADVLPQEKASAIQNCKKLARSRLLEMGSMMLQLSRSRMWDCYGIWNGYCDRVRWHRAHAK